MVLLSERAILWMVWINSDGSHEEAVQHYYDLFGREPDEIHSSE